MTQSTIKIIDCFFLQYWRWYKESGTGRWSSIIDRSRAPSRQCQLDHLLCHRRHHHYHRHYRNHENHRWFSNHCHHHKSISHPAAIPIFVAPSLVTPSWIWRWSLSLIIIVALLLSSYCHREAISQNKFTSRNPQYFGKLLRHLEERIRPTDWDNYHFPTLSNNPKVVRMVVMLMMMVINVIFHLDGELRTLGRCWLSMPPSHWSSGQNMVGKIFISTVSCED